MHTDGMLCCRHFEASRLCGNTETAQNDKVSAGIGLLTGSTAMLLMLLGGCCIIDGTSLYFQLLQLFRFQQGLL